MTPSILICEDDAFIAADIADAIEQAGAEVCGIASSSTEAIELAQLYQPVIAVVDLTLSDGETGGDLAVALSRRGCRIVLHSAATDGNARLASISHMFVAKPLQPDTLRLVVKTALAKLLH